MRKFTKVISVMLCITMLLTLSVSADGYDILFADMQSASISATASFKCENLDFIKEIPGISDIESTLDGELFFGSIFETVMDFKIDYTANDEYTDIDLAFQMGVDLPLKMNNNLLVDAHVGMGVWAMYDVTDENNPVAKIILSTPATAKYIVVDIVEELSLRGMELSAISDACRKVVNKEKISGLVSKYKEIYRNNSALSQNGKKTLITVSQEQFSDMTKQLVDLYKELISDINPEIGEYFYYYEDMAEEIDEEYAEFSDIFAASAKLEFTADKKGNIENCTSVTSMTFNFPGEDEETVTVALESIEDLKYSNVNKNVAVQFPALTDENTVNPYEMYDYAWLSGYDWVFTECTYEPAAENSIYVPLNEFITELRGKNSKYSLSVQNGVITLKDLSDCEDFDTVIFNANSPSYKIDSSELTALNPIKITDGGIYVDNTVIYNVFKMELTHAETDIVSGNTEAFFSRDRTSDEEESEYEDEETYTEEYVDEYDEEYYENYYNCYHSQTIWFGMPFDGPGNDNYFSLRDIIDGYVYAYPEEQNFDISYDNGVVTIKELSGTDALQTAGITVGSNVITVNGTEYTTELPAINYGGRVYVDESAAKALLGFELDAINLIYEISEEDNYSITGTVKSAQFSRKNPKCIHTEDEIYELG